MNQKDQALEFASLLQRDFPVSLVRESLADIVNLAESPPPKGEADGSIDDDLFFALDGLACALKNVEIYLAKIPVK